MDEPAPLPAPAGWIEALERAEADAASGRTIEAEAVHRKLRAGIVRLESEKPDKLRA